MSAPSSPAGPPPATKIPGTHTRFQQKFTPGAMNILESLMGPAMAAGGTGVDFLRRMASGDESLFSELEAPAFRDYERAIGQQASRFSQMGARDSSAFQNALAGEGGALAERLQAQRLGLRQGAVKDLLNLQTMLMGVNPYETVRTPRGQSTEGRDWGKLLMEILPLLLDLEFPGAGTAAKTGAKIGGRSVGTPI